MFIDSFFLSFFFILRINYKIINISIIITFYWLLWLILLFLIFWEVLVHPTTEPKIFEFYFWPNQTKYGLISGLWSEVGCWQPELLSTSTEEHCGLMENSPLIFTSIYKAQPPSSNRLFLFFCNDAVMLTTLFVGLSAVLYVGWTMKMMTPW